MSRYAVCTIVTKSHLAYARALARSLAEHHSDIPLYVLLADRVDGYFDPKCEAFRVLLLDDLAEQSSVERMSFYYTPFEFCTAVRPLLHRYLLENTEHEAWLYLDSDIMICNSLEAVFEELRQTSILLSPHCLKPTENSAVVENGLIKYGVYNGGFLGLRGSPPSTEFLEWWRKRLEFHGLEGNGCYVDQLWLNLVPLFFPQVSLYLHPGANVAYWNLHQRNLTKDRQGRILANGQPLLLTHYSGADLDSPDRVSVRARQFDGRVPPIWKELFVRYIALVNSSGIDTTRKFPYAFDRFLEGTPIKKPMRRLYYEDCLAGTPGRVSPFARGAEFRGRTRRRNVTRLLRKLHGPAKHLPGPLYRGLRRMVGRRGRPCP